MKKLIALALSLVTILSLSACGGKKVTLKILEAEYAVEDYAIGFNKGNTELKEAVNKALAELTADGTIQKIIDKYITAE